MRTCSRDGLGRRVGGWEREETLRVGRNVFSCFRLYFTWCKINIYFKTWLVWMRRRHLGDGEAWVCGVAEEKAFMGWRGLGMWWG